MKVAYFINQYPKVSHSFIRREIQALERQGVEVMRIALRGWADDLADKNDLQERTKTRYVLKNGLAYLLLSVLKVILARPGRFLTALRLVLGMGRKSDRPFIFHTIYLAEACCVFSWLQNSGVKHLHAHFGTNSAEIVMLVEALGGPSYSFTVHGPEEFDKPQAIHLSDKIARSSFVAAISSFGRSQLYRWIGHEHWAKIKVVHCGLEPEFHNVSAIPVPETPRLVCVGRLCEQKGQLLLVEAAHRLNERGIEFELVLAGDGEMRPEVERLIQLYNLGTKVSITGWISSDRVREEILAARGLVLPSFAEGLPVVIMEAMALRRPVLTTYVAGIPELVMPGENGWLFPAGSVDDLTNTLQEFLNCPVDELQKMGDSGHNRVLQRHDIGTEAKKLVALFMEASK